MNSNGFYDSLFFISDVDVVATGGSMLWDFQRKCCLSFCACLVNV